MYILGMYTSHHQGKRSSKTIPYKILFANNLKQKHIYFTPSGKITMHINASSGPYHDANCRPL